MKERGAYLAAIALIFSATAGLAQSSAQGDANPIMRMPELPPAVIDETLAIGGEEIEARKRASRMTVEVMVNGRGPYKFVVDSGADTSVIGQSLAGKLDLPDGDRAFLHGVTESRMVDTVRVNSLQLGSTETLDLELPVLDERDIGGDGMIGLDALTQLRLMMDFEKRSISVGETDKISGMSGDGVIIVTGRLHRGQLILTSVTVDKQRVDAVIDTGSEITIGNSALREKLLRRRPDLFDTIKVFGVTGKSMDLDLAIVKRLRIGPVVLQNLPIAFADIPPFEVFGLHDRPALLIGTDLMENFRRVSLDFDGRKARFQVKSCDVRGIFMRTNRSISRLSADQKSACS